MSKKRKIDRFFEKDINNRDTNVRMVPFFYTDRYKEYVNCVEDYVLNCEKQAINSPPNRYKIIPLKQEYEYKHLPLVEKLVLDEIEDYGELYCFVGMHEENRREEVKDILESLFKKGLIEFELSKNACINVTINSYYSDFFKDW